MVKHRAREVVLSAGSETGRLLFLRSGAVEIVKDGVQISKVSAPGSVFGEQAALLDQSHTADVRALEESEFYVADAPAILTGDPTVALYVAAILARRLDAGNRSLIELKRQLQAGEAPSVKNLIGGRLCSIERQAPLQRPRRRKGAAAPAR
jgi:CRP-like cAMP-binding protein